MPPLAVALVVSLVATAASRWGPSAHAATLVGVTFVVATYLAVPRGEGARYGLAFGGWLEDAPLDARRIVRDSCRALAAALTAAALLFPPFTAAFVLWYEPTSSFSWQRAALGFGGPAYDLLLGHLLVVALPEEAFFRGYLQTSLDERWGARWRVLGAALGPSLVVTSACFALGHFAAIPHPARLAVFFPSLVFGYLRARTGGVGASILFHALCNVYSALLASGFGFSVAS